MKMLRRYTVEISVPEGQEIEARRALADSDMLHVLTMAAEVEAQTLPELDGCDIEVDWYGV